MPSPNVASERRFACPCPWLHVCLFVRLTVIDEDIWHAFTGPLTISRGERRDPKVVEIRQNYTDKRSKICTDYLELPA